MLSDMVCRGTPPQRGNADFITACHGHFDTECLHRISRALNQVPTLHAHPRLRQEIPCAAFMGDRSKQIEGYAKYAQRCASTFADSAGCAGGIGWRRETSVHRSRRLQTFEHGAEVAARASTQSIDASGHGPAAIHRSRTRPHVTDGGRSPPRNVSWFPPLRWACSL